MTNYEKYMSMSIREFAETRIQWNGEFDMLLNDTINTYINDDEGMEKAIQDEIEWLNQESEEEEFCTQDELSAIWHGFGRSE